MARGNTKPTSDQIRSRATRATEEFSRRRKAVFERFPLIFTILATAGLVATLYGFERVFDRIALFSENPYIMLATGLGILLFTGTLYRQLGQKTKE